MKKIWLWICGSLLVLLLASGAVMTTVLLRLDPQTLRTQIISAVQDATGRNLSIGELHMDVFPNLSVRAQQVELNNAPGFSGSFLELSSLDLHIRLIPLLFFRIEMEVVEIDDMELHLGRDAQGQNNWDDMLRADRNEAQTSHTSPGQKTSPVDLVVDDLSLAGRMHWLDERNGQSLIMEDFRLDLKNFSMSDSFSVHSSGTLVLPETQARFTLTMDSTIGSTLLGEDIDFSATLSGKSFPHGPETIRLNAAQLSSDGRVKDVRLEGLGMTLLADSTDGKKGPARLEVSFPEPKKRAERFASLPFAHSLALLDSLTAEWVRHGDRFDISMFQAAVQNSIVQGNASVNLVSGAVDFEVQAQRLDLDMYQAALDADLATASQDQADNFFLPDLNGMLSADELIVQSMRLTKVRCAITARNDTLQFSDFTAQAYGGTLRGAAVIKFNEPDISWTYKVSGVQLEPLLQALHGHALLSGTTDSEGELTAAGLSLSLLKRTLNGNLRFRIRNGAVHGTNIAELLRDEIRLLKGQSPKRSGSDRTIFSEFSGSSIIKNGLETSSDLFLLAPRFQMRGKGQVDLGRETLNLNILIALNGTEGKFEESILGVTGLPLTITGTFAEPVFSLDTTSLLENLGKKSGRTMLKGAEKLGSGVNKGVRDVFRGLMRRLP